jgi:pimeloyl-ACP methyl ester carboxylesterase
MASAYATHDFPAADRYRVAEAHWYEWFLATKFGRHAFETDRKALCRYLWKSWSPQWPFDEAHFERVAVAWDTPDWFEITRHAYMHRWGEAAGYERYAELEDQLQRDPQIRCPTTMLHGSDDPNLPSTSAGKECFFPAGYDRRVLNGIGHFLPREAPQVVVDAILEHL